MTEIKTASELDALPEGSVVADADDTAWQVDLHELWHHTGDEGPQMSDRLAEYYGPLTVLFRPDAPQPATGMDAVVSASAGMYEHPDEDPATGDGVERAALALMAEWECVPEVTDAAEGTAVCERHDASVWVDRLCEFAVAAARAALAAARAGEARPRCTCDQAHGLHDAWCPAQRGGEAVDREALIDHVRATLARTDERDEQVVDAVLAARGDAATPTVTAEQVRQSLALAGEHGRYAWFVRRLAALGVEVTP
ncbi:hypothetical protein MHY85_05235 [Cellulomonas sp. ACRRI]|uniref:hypothetical protein n=1 Tax=Cellulomonas sp. ACRRI TaxID=2918188 RepID=UPI001EF2CC10|nr:hypothetical protein [Cellulomonas sp. ACRRI]MCG7285379.1 hypothetical protein [Cellulomonas sp. ACRRI]